jgi:RNA polymerase sigma-70 factor (ECF subfamily)
MTGYLKLSDPELLALLKEGSQSAFAELYRRYKEPLYFHANRMLGDHDEAKDIVQDVFAAIWSKRESLVIPAAIDAYLYGSIRNRILNFIAHQKVISKYTDSIDAFLEQGVSSTDEKLREKELARIIQKEIALLPEKMREIFEMSRNSEFSYKQIAEQLNISEHTVKKTVQRAIKILRFKIRLNLFFTFFPW